MTAERWREPLFYFRLSRLLSRCEPKRLALGFCSAQGWRLLPSFRTRVSMREMLADEAAGASGLLTPPPPRAGECLIYLMPRAAAFICSPLPPENDGFDFGYMPLLMYASAKFRRLPSLYQVIL